MSKENTPIIEISVAAISGVALFMVYAYTTNTLPSWHLHSEYRLVPFFIESVLAPLPVIIPAYLMARHHKSKGWLIGLAVGVVSAIFGVVIMQTTAAQAFDPHYEWVPEHWAVLYVILGYFSGVTGEAHAG